jgi:hypothetical protein
MKHTLNDLQANKIPELKVRFRDLSHRLLKVSRNVDAVRSAASMMSDSERHCVNDVIDLRQKIDMVPSRIETVRHIAALPGPSVDFSDAERSLQDNDFAASLHSVI